MKTTSSSPSSSQGEKLFHDIQEKFNTALAAYDTSLRRFSIAVGEADRIITQSMHPLTDSARRGIISELHAAQVELRAASGRLATLHDVLGRFFIASRRN